MIFYDFGNNFLLIFISFTKYSNYYFILSTEISYNGLQ